MTSIAMPALVSFIGTRGSEWSRVAARGLSLTSSAGRAACALRRNPTTSFLQLETPAAVYTLVLARCIATQFKNYKLLLEAWIQPNLFAVLTDGCKCICSRYAPGPHHCREELSVFCCGNEVNFTYGMRLRHRRS